MPERIVFKPDVDEKVLIKDKKQYRLIKQVIGKDKHTKEIIFEEITPKFKEAWDKKINELTDYLIKQSKIEIKDVIKNILNSLDLETLNRLERKMKQKIKVKLKRGCLGLTIGNAEISILE